MPVDVAKARADTPGCAEVLHFNNAGAALMPQPVLDAMIGHLRLEARIGAYEAAERERHGADAVYDAIARLIGCAPDEVAIAENATRAWDMAFYSMDFGPGDRILTARAEYGSNYLGFLQVARRTGAVVEAVPSDGSGQLSVEALRGMIDGRVKLIAVTHVPTNGGLVNPAAEIGAVARAAGIPFLLDACQSVGQMPIDVTAIGCDMLSGTARKYLRGPRGMGFLYVRRGFVERLDPPFIDIHAAQWQSSDRYAIRTDARRFENWERSFAAQIAFGVAVEYALALGMEAIRDRVQALAARLRRHLAGLSGVTVHDLGIERCGIVTFTMAGRDPSNVAAALAARRVNVTVSGRGSTLLDMDARGLERVVRASVHYYNTENEVDSFCDIMKEIR